MGPGVSRPLGQPQIMKTSIQGVPFTGTPFFLVLAAMLAGCAWSALPAQAQSVPTPAPTGGEHRAGLPLVAPATAERQRVVLFADWMTYSETTGKLEARGNVRLWYHQLTLTAEEADADLEAQVINARGDVWMIEAERKIHCARLDYHIRDQRVRAEGILFVTHPWYYQGESVEKIGEKEVLISKARFTTCNARRPHYHLTAKRIDVVLGESLTAHHAVLYIGTTPVFYLPWIRRSLKDTRPPFSIDVGYNDFEGFFAKLRFNYYLADENYGGILLDLMEKKGVGLGLEHHLDYQLAGKGSADLSVLYVRDEEVGTERWTAYLTDRHEITDRDLVQLNADYLSDQGFNREFSVSLVDTYQQKSYLSYSHRGDRHYWSLGISNTESWDPSAQSYYTSSRELPAASYSLSSVKFIDIKPPVYFGLSSSLNRHFDRITDDTVVVDINDPIPVIGNRYQDDLKITPRWTQTYTFPLYVPTQPSLSGSLSLPVTALHREKLFETYAPDNELAQTELDAAYTTNVTLTNKWVNYRYTKPTHLLQTQVSHNFTRNFPLLEDMNLPKAGVSLHRLGLSADYTMGNLFYLQTRTGYKLLDALEEPDWRALMEPLSFNGRVTLLSRLFLTWQGQYDWEKERVTTGFVSTSTSGNNWSIALNGSYSYLGSVPQEYSLFSTLTGSYAPWQGIRFNSSLQYDVVKGEFTNFTLALARDLHCWSMQASFKVYQDGVTSLGFGLSLKAFPEVKVGMGGSESISVGN